MIDFAAAGQDSFAIPRVSQKGFGEGTGRFTPGGSNKGSLKEREISREGCGKT